MTFMLNLHNDTIYVTFKTVVLFLVVVIRKVSNVHSNLKRKTPKGASCLYYVFKLKSVPIEVLDVFVIAGW